MDFKAYLMTNGYSSLTYLSVINHYIAKNKISQDAIYKYILNLKSNRSIEYTNLNIKALKVYLLYLNKDIKLPKLYKTLKTLPDSITEGYLNENLLPMIEVIFDSNVFKIKTLLNFMFYTGVRRNELVYLKRKDFDFNENMVKIYGEKTKKERIVVYPDKVRIALKQYFNEEKQAENAFNLNKTTVKNLFLRLKPFFPDINLRPHLMRHSFATHLIKKGVPLPIVSKLLGHSSFQTTERYLRLDIEIYREVYNNKKMGIRK